MTDPLTTERLDFIKREYATQGSGDAIKLGVMGEAMAELVGEVERLRAELRLARAVIHELAWGPDTIIDKPRLWDALKAWGEADKVDLPPEGSQP